jgi:hypothetical protein
MDGAKWEDLAHAPLALIAYFLPKVPMRQRHLLLGRAASRAHCRRPPPNHRGDARCCGTHCRSSAPVSAAERATGYRRHSVLLPARTGAACLPQVLHAGRAGERWTRDGRPVLRIGIYVRTAPQSQRQLATHTVSATAGKLQCATFKLRDAIIVRT